MTVSIHHMNGKPLLSADRVFIADCVLAVELALGAYCSGKTPKARLEDAILRMNQRLRYNTMRSHDPWVTAVHDRVRVIQATIDLLVASGQL